VYLDNEERVEDFATRPNYYDHSFDFLQDALVTLSIYGDWLGILAVNVVDRSQKIYILDLRYEAEAEPVLVHVFPYIVFIFFSPRVRQIASSYSLNTHITGFSFVNGRFLLVGTSGAILVFRYSVPGRKQPVLRLRIDDRIIGMWVHKSPVTLLPKYSNREFVPAKTGRGLLVIRIVTPAPRARNKTRGYLGRVLVTVTKIFDFLTEKYPSGTALSPSEWKRFILPQGYLPLPHLLERMDYFVSGTRMVLPVSEMDDGRIKYVEYNFDQHWAMFVDWMARCGDEAAREWAVKRCGPFIVSSRPFYVPKETTNVMITDDYMVVSAARLPSFSCVD
jgi:hypothetical protein